MSSIPSHIVPYSRRNKTGQHRPPTPIPPFIDTTNIYTHPTPPSTLENESEAVKHKHNILHSLTKPITIAYHTVRRANLFHHAPPSPESPAADTLRKAQKDDLYAQASYRGPLKRSHVKFIMPPYGRNHYHFCNIHDLDATGAPIERVASPYPQWPASRPPVEYNLFESTTSVEATAILDEYHRLRGSFRRYYGSNYFLAPDNIEEAKEAWCAQQVAHVRYQDYKKYKGKSFMDRSRDDEFEDLNESYEVEYCAW